MKKKTILVGDSFATYNNGYYISIASTYMGGYNTDFLTTVSTSNIKFIKSGQHVNLISMKTSNNTYYWHVLTGFFIYINLYKSFKRVNSFLISSVFLCFYI